MPYTLIHLGGDRDQADEGAGVSELLDELINPRSNHANVSIQRADDWVVVFFADGRTVVEHPVGEHTVRSIRLSAEAQLGLAQAFADDDWTAVEAEGWVAGYEPD